MAAVPIYVWNGSAWQEIGPTIPASPIAYQASAPASPSTGDVWVDSDGDVTTGSQQFQRFRFVASGGETTISGADANGAILAYAAGLEQVVLNGAVLVRGQDYTATDGTTITGLSPALVASDVLEVFSFIAFTVANTYTQSQVDGLVATATAAPGMKLLVPTSADNGTVSASGAVTFTGVSSVSLNGVFSSTYDNYMIQLFFKNTVAQSYTALRYRVSGADDTNSVYDSRTTYMATSSIGVTDQPNLAQQRISYGDNNGNYHTINISRPFIADKTYIKVASSNNDGASGMYAEDYTGVFQNATSFTGFTIFPAANNITGTIRVYGYKN